MSFFASQTFTLIHTVLSLIGIAAGLVVLFGLLRNNPLNSWTLWFLVTTVATTLTGFLFPFRGFTPAIGTGIVSSLVLAATLPGALHVSACRFVALDLRGRRSRVAVPELLRAGRAGVPESAGAARTRAAGHRAAVRPRHKGSCWCCS